MAPAQQLAISEHLSETKAELLLFVRVCDALHLRHPRNAVQFPRQVEVRLVWARRTRQTAREPTKVANAFCVRACPRKPRSTRAGSTANGSRVPTDTSSSAGLSSSNFSATG